MSDFDFLNPQRKKVRIEATHEEVVADVKKFIEEEKIEKKVARRKYDKWAKAKYKYNTLNRITTWARVLDDLGYSVAKPAKVTDQELVDHFLEVAKYYKKAPTKELFGKYHAEVKNGPNWSLLNQRWGATKFRSLVWEYLQGTKTIHDIEQAKTKKRKPISPRLRAEVLKRDGYKCVHCGATAKSSGKTLHLNHKLPVSRGGKNTKENLETTCQDCNLGMSDKIIAEE